MKWQNIDCGERAVCESGSYPAKCLAVIDLGVQRSFSEDGEPKRRMALYFEIDRKIEVGSMSGKNFRLGKIFTASLHPKSSFRKTLIAWAGKDPVITKNGQPDFDVEKLIGKLALVSVINEKRPDRTVSLISAVSKPIAGMVNWETKFDPEIDTPEWIKRMSDARLPENDEAEPSEQAAQKPVADPIREEQLKNDEQTAEELAFNF